MIPEFLQEDSATDRPAAPRLSVENLSRRNGRRVVAFKFGGSSLLGAERMLHAAALVQDAARTARVTVVVSAMKGVIDRLLALGRCSNALPEAEQIVQFHHNVLCELRLAEEAFDRVQGELRFLGRDLLHEASVLRRAAEDGALLDRLASFGERLSARLFAAALEKIGVPAVPVASSDFIVTCDTFRDAQPHLAQSRKRGSEVLLPMLEAGIVPVVTGFIGATPDGRITTMGRNSSDFSGAIIADVVEAEELVIWTDVDGIYTANPNESEQARLLHNMSYDEAHALAAAGAKVLHPRVLPLAAETEMTVWVRNTFKPHLRGTRIGSPGDPGRPTSPGGAA
jgi:bifunctional aspartokinase / homoserine dehydrogenase 1